MIKISAIKKSLCPLRLLCVLCVAKKFHLVNAGYLSSARQFDLFSDAEDTKKTQRTQRISM